MVKLRRKKKITTAVWFNTWNKLREDNDARFSFPFCQSEYFRVVVRPISSLICRSTYVNWQQPVFLGYWLKLHFHNSDQIGYEPQRILLPTKWQNKIEFRITYCTKIWIRFQRQTICMTLFDIQYFAHRTINIKSNWILILCARKATTCCDVWGKLIIATESCVFLICYGVLL